jgi:ABC-type branched-subunit amino acid transport system ATPase component/ABC-type branched-subunit amino acid transport system permease subunit
VITVASTFLGRRTSDIAVHIAIPVSFVLLFMLTSGDSYLTYLATAGAISYVLTSSFNLVFGYAGIFSLASIAFYGIGAYASVYAENEWGLPFWFSFPFAILVASVIAAILIMPTSHLRDIFIAIVTLSFAVTAVEVFAQWKSVTGGAGGIYLIEPPSIGDTVFLGGEASYLMFCLVIAWLVAELSWRISRSGFGRKLIAVREAPRALSASGVSEAKARFAVFVLSSGLAGLAGAMYAHFQLIISPEAFSVMRLIELLLATVIGGAGTFLGPFLGVIVLIFIDEVGARMGDLEPIVYGVAVVVLMAVGRHGVANLFSNIWRRLVPERAKVTGAAEAADVIDHTLLREEAVSHGDGPLLKVENVTVQFGGVRAVNDVSLALAPGEIVGMVGPNGAGKTSLFNAITGEVPLAGDVVFAGESILKMAPHQRRKQGIGRTFQLPSLVPEMTLVENVMIGGETRSKAGLFRQSLYLSTARADDRARRREAMALLTELGLGDRALGRASDQPYGVQRLAEIARSLMLSPDLLMLDEPGAGLTNDERGHLADVINHLRRRKLTVIVIDHNVGFVASISDRMIVMDGGQLIADGLPDEVMKVERVVSAYLGSEASSHD